MNEHEFGYEKQQQPPGFQQSDYNSWSQNTGYVNPTFANSQPPPNYAPPIPGQTVSIVSFPGQQVGQNVVVPQVQETSTVRHVNSFGAIVAIIVLILVITALSTDYWIDHPTYHLGLWRICFEYIIRDICIHVGYLSVMFTVVQAMTIIGVCLLLPAVILHCLVAWGQLFSKRSRATSAIVLYSISGVFLVIAVALAGTNFVGTRYVDKKNKFGFSYYLMIVGAVGAIAMNILVSWARSHYNPCGKVININAQPAPNALY